MARVWGKVQKRFKLHRQQNGLCPLCGMGLRFADVTLDHKIPRSRGGRGTLANLQATHALCNNLKGNKIIEIPPTKSEMKTEIQRRLSWRPGQDTETT